MGVNNRARRAAKQRKHARNSHRPKLLRVECDCAECRPPDRPDATGEFLQAAVVAAAADPTSARRYAARAVAPGAGVSLADLAGRLRAALAVCVRSAVERGWTPSDLSAIASRRVRADADPLLAVLLTEETDRHPASRVVPAWQDELDQLGLPLPVELDTERGLEVGLGLCGVLMIVPAITRTLPPPGSDPRGADPSTGGDVKALTRVRALLAKAESTEFPEEAEALSGKAQELISRYALERLLDEPAPTGADAGGVACRRLWLDAPYVPAKAALADAVGSANRCRVVLSESLGFVTVVGEPGDIRAVELLTTSLLVQAQAAVLRCGSQAFHRTTSFRRSFLYAYAARIGERLSAASAAAEESTGRSGELVPLLADREQRVAQAVEERFPNLVEQRASVANHAGWAAGVAAADLAQFGTVGSIGEQAS